jgi:hypothetical protein
VPGVTVAGLDVTGSLYHNPRDGSYVLLAIHHGPGRVLAGMTLHSRQLRRAVEVSQDGPPVATSGDVIVDTFGPYEVRIYELGAG